MANTREKPNKFQQWCMENNMEAAKVAELIGVSKFTVYSYWRGDRQPSRKVSKQMKEKLGFDPNEIFDF